MANFPRLICLSVLLSVVSFSSKSSAEMVTIMPLGDSITAGFNGPPSEDRGSYRHDLGEMLSDARFSVDFVGEFQRGPDDPDHQGLSGAGIERMVLDFGPALERFQPDYALVLAGTNNHFSGPDESFFLEQYRDLVNMIRDNSPETSIIFATVPKFGYDRIPETSYWTREWVDFRNEQTFPTMNRAIYQISSEFDDISVVDYNAVLDPATDLVRDAVHPNSSGHRKLAELFYGELSGRLTAVPEPAVSGILLLASSFFMVHRHGRKPVRAR